jgi:hypothetical protein
MTQTTENTVPNNSIAVCVFIATGMYLLSLAMIRGHGKQANSSGSLEAGVFSADQPKVIQGKQLSAQDHCVQEPETWKISFMAPLFQPSEFRGDIQQTRLSQKVVWIHLAQNRDQWWAIVYKH